MPIKITGCEWLWAKGNTLDGSCSQLITSRLFVPAFPEMEIAPAVIRCLSSHYSSSADQLFVIILRPLGVLFVVTLLWASGPPKRSGR